MNIKKSRALTVPSELSGKTPAEIVAELDKFIVGQPRAKRALALALRDRERRHHVSKELAAEIQPRNVILIGPTGIGKTELAKRLARLSSSPFIKVEASKFTEVGYVGRDVESIIRDLTELAVDMVREDKVGQVCEEAEANAEERLLEILTPKKKRRNRIKTSKVGKEDLLPKMSVSGKKTKDKLRKQLREGKLNSRVVELEVQERFFPSYDMPAYLPEEEADLQFRDLLAGVMGTRTFNRKMRVDEAIDYLITEEESKLIDMDQVAREALDRTENDAIVFVDEIDKIAGREGSLGPDVSREGVQRDILPIVEGTAVSTRFGLVQTDRILFIAAGAFHVTKPSDLIPELQGRFPVRVELSPLSEQDFVEILKKPQNALVRQYKELMRAEGIDLSFTEGAIREIAHFAWRVNESTENIGARRLHTVMEALLEDISFRGPELSGKRIQINVHYVRDKLEGIVKDKDLSRYIL